MMTSLSVRAYFEPHSEERPDLVADMEARDKRVGKFVLDNKKKLEHERRIVRGLAFAAATVCSILVISLLIWSQVEQQHMSDAQRQTLIEHPQDN